MGVRLCQEKYSSINQRKFLAYHDERQIIPEIFASYKQLEIYDLRKFQND